MKFDVSIIYVYYNTPKELEESIKSIPSAVGKLRYEIIVVDNGSSKNVPQKLQKNKKVKVVKNVNSGYGAGLNLGSNFARGNVLILSNPDVVFKSNSITQLHTRIQDKKAGIVGPQMLNRHGKILPTISGEPTIKAIILSTSFISKFFKNSKSFRNYWLINRNRKLENKVSVISGACMAVRREVFDEVGGFDENFFMYFEENDLCLRVKEKGYEIVFFPLAKVFHQIGASTGDKDWIEKNFTKSRFLFFKKNNPFYKAVIAEAFLRITTIYGMSLLSVFVLALFVNIYKLDEQMIFIGDMARDYVFAKEWILEGKFPLVGIPSSVPWLHQGPTSLYLVTLSLMLTNFNPIAPSVLFGFLGAVTTVLVYFLGKEYFGKKVGLAASILYTASPIIVVNARMPYHTSLVPIFTVVFFLFLPYFLKHLRRLYLLGFLLGLMMLVELSNAVIFFVLIALLFIKRIKISARQASSFIIGFIVGVAPFIVFDFINGPTYAKFPLWIINRVVLRTNPNAGDSQNMVANFLPTLYQQVSGIILPNLPLISITLFITSCALVSFRIIRTKKTNEMILFLWISIPLIAFSVHNSPGTAYFAVLYPGIILILAYSLINILKFRIAIFLSLIFFILNAGLLLKNEFYVNSQNKFNRMPPLEYSYGNTYTLALETSKAIVMHSTGRNIKLVPQGIMKMYDTSLDPYRFFIWKLGGKLDDKGMVYMISESGYKTDHKVIFINRTDQVAVYE